MEQVAEKLEKSDRLGEINKTLERQNEIMQQMLEIMPRPAGKLQKVLETILLFVGIAGIFVVLDVVINWIGGG